MDNPPNSPQPSTSPAPLMPNPHYRLSPQTITIMTYPLLTIDTFAHYLYTTFSSPLFASLIPLTLLSTSHPLTSFPVLTSLCYFLLSLFFHSLLYLDRLLQNHYHPPRTPDWKSEVVVITGGAGGLGSLIAEIFARRGVAVAVLDVRGQERREEWEERGIRWFKCDVGRREEVERVGKMVEEELGTPTILINNAAVVNGKPLLQLAPEEIDRTYRVNLLSNIYTIQTFLPAMLLRPAGGTIVTVSSVLGQLGCACLADYTSTKAALSALHTSLSAELLHSPPHPPISLLHILPGQLSTPLFSSITPPSTFLGPIVPASYLARKIVEKIDKGESGEIAEPLYTRWVWILRGLPAGVGEWVRGVAGVDGAALGGFRGGGRGDGGIVGGR